METFQTDFGRHLGHPDFRLTYDPVRVPVRADIEWLASAIEHAATRGERFAPGETYQVGWMLLEIRAGDEGFLALWEPDMKHMPVRWVESVTATLAHLRIQKDVCDSVLPLDELTFPSMRQSCIICSRLGKTERLVMERLAPNGSDSGWFFGCYDEGHDHQRPDDLTRVSVFEAAVSYAPAIIPYLALPPGVLAAVGPDAPVMFRNGEPLEFKPGSFLAALFES